MISDMNWIWYVLGFHCHMTFLLRKRTWAGFGILGISSSATRLDPTPESGLSISSIFFLRKKTRFFFSLHWRVFFLFDSFWLLHFEAIHISIFHFHFYFLLFGCPNQKCLGFQFQPTDVELIEYFLKRKVRGKKFPSEIIAKLDLYKFAPWDLPSLHLHSFHGVLYCVIFSLFLCVFFNEVLFVVCVADMSLLKNGDMNWYFFFP